MAGLTVTVKPGSKQPGFAFEGETWMLRVREHAIEGAANDACLRAVASRTSPRASRPDQNVRGARVER
ncbi:MAG: DUF167 domain-containing protein [Candidatus Eremiobacteraeota bacterium]|nr:DUF167 domain-containing protein [Candidatus Eremiobacteraeota bacterium]